MRDPSESGGRALQRRPAELERLLNSPEASAAMKATDRGRLLAEVHTQKLRLLNAVCSAAWFDDCWATGSAFPPPADNAPMLPCRCERCRSASRFWPVHYGASVAHERGAAQVLSYECHLESLPLATVSELPSSPSGVALRAIREGRIKLARRRTRIGGRGRSRT